MGEDIHSKNLVYSKVEQCYIDALSLTTCPEYSPFGPLYDGRNYDFFSLFGSCRSNWPQLKYANYGVPDFLPKTYAKYLEDSGYYGYIWWKLPDFKKALLEYIKLLSKPKKFYEAAEEDWALDLIANGEFDERAYDEDKTYIQRTLKHFVRTLEEIEDYSCDERMKELIDIKETVFLFYFDS